MKRFTTFVALLLVLPCLSMLAQRQELFGNGTRWEMFHGMVTAGIETSFEELMEDDDLNLMSSMGLPLEFFIDRYEVKGDTLIDGMRYKKVYVHRIDVRKNSNAKGEIIYYEIKESKIPPFFIREDDDGVLYLLNKIVVEGSERLVMGDYLLIHGLQREETFDNTDRKELFVADYGKSWCVGDIVHYAWDFEQKNEAYTMDKTIMLKDGNSYPVHNEMIYGIGDIHKGPFMVFYDYMSAASNGKGLQTMMSFSRNGELLYVNDAIWRFVVREVEMFNQAYSANIVIDNLFDYATGVNHVMTERIPNNTLYDLQGRRLSRRPDKGLYIEDGKIVSFRASTSTK